MELTMIRQWLSGFPGFAGCSWEEDRLPHKPGTVSLLSKGIQTVAEKEDLLGNRRTTLRFTCTVAFSGNGQAQTLWDLQHWVARQSHIGGCPRLGQGKTSAALEDGRHLTNNKLGLDLYTAQLKLTYEIDYEVNENGED